MIQWLQRESEEALESIVFIGFYSNVQLFAYIRLDYFF